MFCYQCKKASGGCGCIVRGNCGKPQDCAGLQDMLIQMLMGISAYTARANELQVYDRDIDDFVLNGLVATMTGVNHDPESLKSMISDAYQIRSWAKSLMEIACIEARMEPYTISGPCNIEPANTIPYLVEQSWQYSIPLRRLRMGEILVDRQEMILYGLKGVAKRLKQMSDDDRYDRTMVACVHQILDALACEPEDFRTLDDLAGKTGHLYYCTMERIRENRISHQNYIPSNPRYETLLDRGSADLTLKIDSEKELDDALWFVRAFINRWVRECEQYAVSDWSVCQMEPLGLRIDFNWDSQESIAFYLAVKQLGVENVKLNPIPAFMNTCSCAKSPFQSAFEEEELVTVGNR